MLQWSAKRLHKRCATACGGRGGAFTVFFSFVALASTFVYVADVRQRYDNRAPAPFAEIGEELRRWHGDVPLPLSSPSSPASHTLAYAGVSSVVVPVNTAVASATTEAGATSLADSARLGRRNGAGLSSHYHLQETRCYWGSSSAGRVSPPRRSPNASKELLLFFIHGNSGGASQGHVWSCAVALQALLSMAPGSVSGARTYTFDFSQQANVHRGRLLGLQADFVADAVEAEVRRQLKGGEALEVSTHSVWLVGHSMGGIVARTAAALLKAGRQVEVRGVLTFNTPHRYPPLVFDRPLRDLYASLQTVAQTCKSNATAATGGAVDSLAFVEACAGGGVEGRSVGCQEYGPPPLLLSLTSGEMDLQIEQATAYPLCAPPSKRWGARRAVSKCFFANMQSASTCGHSASHDGCIRDACMVAYAAAAVHNATRCRADDDSCVSAALPSMRLASGPAVGAEGQLALAASPLLGWLGRRLWWGHLWPLAASTLLISLLLSPVVQRLQAFQADVGGVTSSDLEGDATGEVLLTMPVMSHHPAERRRRLAVLLCLARPLTNAASATGALVVLVNTTLFVLVLLASVFDVEWLLWDADDARPWVWDRWLPLAPFPSSTASVAERIAVGTPFSTTDVLLHGCKAFPLLPAAVCVGVSAAAGVEALARRAPSVAVWLLAAVGRPLRKLKGPWCSPPRETGLWGSAPLTAAVILAYGGALLLSVSMTRRAILWLTLSAVAAGAPTTPRGQRRNDDVDGGANACHASSPAILFATLHLLQLQPAFAIRNELVSHTRDVSGTVDWLLYLTELCAVAQLAPALPTFLRKTVAATRPPSKQGTHLKASALPPIEAVSYVGGCFGCVMLAVSPVEMSHLPVALLLSFFAFILSTANS